MGSKEISVIGVGVIDFLVGAVDEKLFKLDGQDVDYMKFSFGGDALNEAIALARLGKKVHWISKVGDDDAGHKILNYAAENGVDISGVKVEADLETAVTVVLVDKQGERRFLTNPRSSLRKLALEDILPHVDDMAQIVSFASMFISSLLDASAMEKLFKRIKASGRTLAVDMKCSKNGETLKDLAGVLSSVDYFFPNEFELSTLTGETDVQKNIETLLESGLKCAVVKRGGEGCIIATKSAQIEIPAYRVEKVIDTTGAGGLFCGGLFMGVVGKLGA